MNQRPEPEETENDETTGERILRVAAELFAEKGYAATSVAEIADAAGIVKGGLYYHIGSKDELLYTISRRHVDEALVACEEVISSELSAEEKLRLVSRLHIRTIWNHLPEIVTYFRDGHSLSRQRKRLLRKVQERWEGVWQTILEEGMASGEFRRADPIALKFVFGAYIHSWAWLKLDGDLSAEQLADQMVDLALKGVLSQ